MSFRITTNGMFRNYSSNLHNNMKKISDTMTRVETGRAFNSYAEDPAAASRAFQMRRSYWRTGDQIDNSNYLISKLQTGWDALDVIVDGNSENPGLDGIRESLAALNGTAGSTRKTLGITLMSTANSIVQLMNVRYGDEFVFAGADGLNAPFAWDEDTQDLAYRGVSVNVPKPLTEEEFNAQKAAGETTLASFSAYKTKFEEDYGVTYEKAAIRFDEATYVDIGLGMKGDENGDVIPATAYNSAVNGLEILGYGTEEIEISLEPEQPGGSFTVTVSKNLAQLMRDLGKVFDRCDPQTGEYASLEDKKLANALTGRLQNAISYVQEQHVKLDGEVKYLKDNLGNLELKKDTLTEQIIDVEDLDPADAITQMMWAQYCYNAALRIGNQILSQSLIDYLN